MALTSESTCAERIFNDENVQKAKETLLESIHKYKETIRKIRPPQEGLKQSYAETIDSFNLARGLPLWLPYVGSGMGNGPLVELADGSVKYDFISGIGVHFGHCHPLLIASSLDAALQNTVMQGQLQQNTDSLKLMKLLLEGSGMDHCILTTSGAMANENALKIIFQKKYPAHRVLAFDRCFVGRTLALAQITDRPQYREKLPQTLQVDYIPFYDWKNPQVSTKRALETLEGLLKRYPKEYACMCMEMIQGEGGFYPGSQEFFYKLIQLLKENEVAVFVDEVQSFGRTDRLFAFQHYHLHNLVDVVTIGKLSQVCATLYHKAYKPKSGLISQTFTSSTAAIRASYAIVHSLMYDGFLGSEGKNMLLRKHFVGHLQRLSEKYPDHVEGPFGHGLMIAFTPFKGDQEKVIAYLRALFESGVIAFVTGSNPTRIRFLIPAGSASFEDLDIVAGILEETLKRFM